MESSKEIISDKELIKRFLRNTELAAWANCEAAGFLERLIERDSERLIKFLQTKEIDE
jgi:hypothetical protein